MHIYEESTCMCPTDALHTLAHLLDGRPLRDACDELSFDSAQRRDALKLSAGLDRVRSEQRFCQVQLVLRCENDPSFMVHAKFPPLVTSVDDDDDARPAALSFAAATATATPAPPPLKRQREAGPSSRSSGSTSDFSARGTDSSTTSSS